MKLGQAIRLLTVFSLIALAILAVLFQTVAAQGTSASPVVLTDEQAEYPLGLHLQLLEDPGGTLTIEEVSSPAYNDQFIPSQKKVPNFGYTDSAYWARVQIDNQSSQMENWLLEDSFVNTFFLDLYTHLPDGKGFSVKQSGMLRPPATRDLLHPHIIFNLSIPSHSQQTLYLRFKSGASMTMPLTLWKESTFLKYSLPLEWIAGIFYGALIGLLLYNIFLFISLHEISYFYLVMFLASYLAWSASYDGYLETYFNTAFYYLKPYYIPVFMASIFIYIVLFGDTFLELKTRLPRLHQMGMVVLAIWGALLLLIPFTPYYFLARLMVAWALLSVGVPIMAAIILRRKQFTAARYYLIAWLGTLLTLSLILFVRLGLLPSNFLTENVHRVGVVWMAVCWSIALADRINLLKAETESVNRELHRSENRLSQILQGLPVGVAVFGKNMELIFVNRKTSEILGNLGRNRPESGGRRTLAQVMDYYMLHRSGTPEKYLLEDLPIFHALKGNSSYTDDLEAGLDGQIVPLEMWASPIKDSNGEIEAAVAAFQDITSRKQAEALLTEYQEHLESIVEERTTDLNATNKELHIRLEWLAAVNFVNQMIARSVNFTEIHETMIEIIKNLLAMQDCFIAEVASENNQFRILSHSHSKMYPDLLGSFVHLPGLSQRNTKLEHGKPITFLKEEFGSWSGPFGLHVQSSEIQSIAFVPLQVHDRILGLLGLEMREEERRITNEEANLLSIFSTDIAQLIVDARLLEQSKLLVAAEERNRLARELHDSVAQTLYSISLYINATRLALKSEKPGTVQSHLEELTQLSKEAMADMRLLIFELRSPTLEKNGLAAALQSRLESVEAKSGFQTRFVSDGNINLSPAQESELYRIAQEALNNVIKHAQANLITVRLTKNAGCTSLMIEDDGVGFDPLAVEHCGGQGLLIMRERAAKIGARFLFESAPGQGTKITIEVNE